MNMQAPPRIATLDILRGAAVMGILAMNIVSFALPPAAYLNPMAYGVESAADLASWALSFVFIDGKMRGLFSLLFGASVLLVIERAQAKGERAAAIHYSRMLWLLALGLIHFYFIWYGDILTTYAAIGLILWFFRNKAPEALLFWGGLFIVLQFAAMAFLAAGYFSVSAAASAPGASESAVEAWAAMKQTFGIPGAADLQQTLALYRGGWIDMAQYRLREELFEPATMMVFFAAETLGYMLVGMACLKNGFLSGAWDDAALKRAALIGFAISIPAYAIGAGLLLINDFPVPMLVTVWMAGATLFRLPMVIAWAALIMLLTRRGGRLVERIAAAGRAAFTNYLGASILMTGLFYGWGLGLFGTLSRAQLWLVVIPAWGLMLLWSKPWLDLYRYGPFEWLWRSLARGRIQPMRRVTAA